MSKTRVIFLLSVVSVLLFSQINLNKINHKNFSFAVLGDRTGISNQEIFEQILTTIKSMKTDFVINVGDLIEGYTNFETIINNEWDSIFDNLGTLKEQFYFTAGNHDIWDSLSYQVYLNRTGYQKPYYTFSIGKNHFIVLDNSRQDKVEKPDSIQLAWLHSALSKYKKNDNFFCFMHKSFWKDAYINNKPDTFHKLFVKYGVDYVFSGHDHFYCQLEWDGITYTQVGPSGSRYKMYRKQEFGAFQNFVVVSVNNNNVEIKVIKPDGKVLNSDIVTLQEIQELEKIEKSVKIAKIAVSYIPDGANVGITKDTDEIEVIVDNINTFPLNSIGKWDLGSGNWNITPPQTMISIPVQTSRSYRFDWQTLSETIYPLPKFTITYPYSLTGNKTYQVEKLFPIHVQAQCLWSSQPIKIDGKLCEKIWHKAKPLYIFGSSDGARSSTDPWQVSFAYDDNYIYLAAKMTDYEIRQLASTITKRDERVYDDDHLNIVLQPTVVSDTYYQFFINANGVVMDRACYMLGKDSKKDVKWNSNIIAKGQIENSKSFQGWTLEIAIPFKDFTQELPTQWGFNLVRFQKRKETVSIYSVPFEHNPKTFAILNFIK